jgi:uncharacterized membrane protein
MTTETARVEAFSDGVFAIAITLLILEIKVPSPESGELARQLLTEWPSYLSFVISFMFIGIMWMNHHRLFTHVKRCDELLVVLNLLLLFGVTFVPFPASVLAVHLGRAGQRTATLLFNGTYFAISIFFNILWRHASSGSRHLLASDVDMAAVHTITHQYAFGPILYLICFVLGWVSVPASLVLNFALACFFALPPKFGASLAAPRQRHKREAAD